MSESHDGAAFTPVDAFKKLHYVDDVRTTAKRLAAYRDELVAAGFTSDQANEFVATAAPGLIEDLVVAADVEDENPPIGEVRIHLRPQINDEDVARVAQEIQRRAEIGQRFLGRSL
jgi:NAD(P)-dependent dehydrogenase (short-subunit alcohol dehydrogenase family)